MSSSYRRSLEEWLSQQSYEVESALDIGGAQLAIPDRVKHWQVDKYRIADLAKPHKQKHTPDYLFNVEEDVWLPQWGVYDIVFCLEVFEYIINPIRAMGNIYLATKDKAIITFPFCYPIHEPVQADSLRYTRTAIERLAHKTGFKIDAIHDRIAETPAILNAYSSERLRAAKGVDHRVLGYIVELSK